MLTLKIFLLNLWAELSGEDWVWPKLGTRVTPQVGGPAGESWRRGAAHVVPPVCGARGARTAHLRPLGS